MRLYISNDGGIWHEHSERYRAGRTVVRNYYRIENEFFICNSCQIKIPNILFLGSNLYYDPTDDTYSTNSKSFTLELNDFLTSNPKQIIL